MPPKGKGAMQYLVALQNKVIGLQDQLLKKTTTNQEEFDENSNILLETEIEQLRERVQELENEKYELLENSNTKDIEINRLSKLANNLSVKSRPTSPLPIPKPRGRPRKEK